jgi:UMP-CMP kinase
LFTFKGAILCNNFIILLMSTKDTTVVFILGGPGSGKGTASERIQSEFKFVHLSAGDLLRAERKQPGSQYGETIEKYIVEGKIVPSEITVMLLQKAMEGSGMKGGRFLIDGFPRNLENLSTWEKIMDEKVDMPFILHLECSEKVMEERLLKRGETSGRSDDNIESIRKRFVTYEKETREIVKYFDEKEKNYNVNSDKDPKLVFEDIRVIFASHKLI